MGTVVSVEQTSTSKLGEWIYITVTLDVSLPGGKQQVKADGWRIKAIDAPRLQAEQAVPVKIDPQHLQFVFPDCAWIEMVQHSVRSLRIRGTLSPLGPLRIEAALFDSAIEPCVVCLLRIGLSVERRVSPKGSTFGRQSRSPASSLQS